MAISNMKLAELMDSVVNEDKIALKAMLDSMSAEDVAYFKGYVAGYAEAARHLQADSQAFDELSRQVKCSQDGVDSES